MPMTGSIEADFSGYVAECEKADRALASMEEEAKKVDAALGAMGETADESAKKAGSGLGQAGKRAKETGDELKKVPSAMDGIGKAAQALGISLTAAFAIDTIKQFWTDVINTADALQDIADETGMTTEQVSRLSTVAEGAGLKIEDIAKASAKLQSALRTEAGESAVARLGLDLERLKAADPYSQLQQVAAGLGTIQDSSERLRYQQDLLGDGSVKLARIMGESFDEATASVTSASSEALTAIADLKGGFESSTNTLKAWATEGLGSIVIAGQAVRDFDWAKTWDVITKSASFEEFIANMRRAKQEADLIRQINEYNPTLQPRETWLPGPTKEQLEASAAARKKLEKDQAAEWDAYVREEQARVAKVTDAQARLNEARQGNTAILATMSAATRTQIAADLEFGLSQSDLALALGLTEVQIRAVANSMKEQKTEADNLAAANKKVTSESMTAYSELAAAGATSMQQQILAIGSWRARTMGELAATKGATVEHYEAIDRIAQEKLANVGVNWETLRAGSVQTLRETYETAERTYQRMLSASNEYTPQALANQRKVRDEAQLMLQSQTQFTEAQRQMFAEAKPGYDSMIASLKALGTNMETIPPLQDLIAAGFNKWDMKRWQDEAEQAMAPLQEMDAVSEYMRAYGVDVETARKALGLMGDTGDDATKKVAAGTNAATQATIQLNAALGAAKTAYESVAAGHELMNAYREAGIFVGGTIATGGYDFSMMKKAGIPTANQIAGWTPGRTSTEPWGNQNTLNINVNNATADDLAKKLTSEMRHQGVRF